MTINSYFFDSVDNDKPYSAADFAKAFNIGFSTGVLPDEYTGALGFNITGGDFKTVNEGRAIIEGRFVEVTDTEILTVPAGSYTGQIVIRVDANDTRTAVLAVKTDQQPIQGADFYEYPLYNCTVSNSVITGITDLRTEGGAIAKTAANVCTWYGDPNGVVIETGLYNNIGKPILLYLTSAQPAASPNSHNVWIQIDNF